MATDREETHVSQETSGDVTYKSLYEVVVERNMKHSRKTSANRSFYLLQTSDDTPPYHGHEEIDKVVKEIQEDNGISNNIIISGFLLSYPLVSIVLIETTYYVSQLIMHKFLQSIQSSEGLLQKGIVLGVTHNISERMFESWSGTLIKNPRVTGNYSEPVTEAAESIAVDVMNTLCKTINAVHRQIRNKTANLERLESEIYDTLRHQVFLEYLISSGAYPSVEKFREMSECSPFITQDNHVTWPLSRKLDLD